MNRNCPFSRWFKAGFYILLLVSVWDTCRAATFTWSGNGVDNNWSTPANWTGGVVPANDGTATVVLAGTNEFFPVVDIPWNIAGLTFSTNGGAFTLSGNTLTIRAGGIYNSNVSPQIISNAIVLYTNQTWTAASNNLTFAGNISNAGTNLLTLAGNFNTLISGVISGAGAVTKTGTGTNIWTGSNSYSGVTTILAGVLNIQNPAALGGGSAVVTVASGAALQLQNGISVTNKPLTLAGTGLTNSGALRNLSGSNSWSGPITIIATTMIASDAGTLSLLGNITNSTFALTFTNVGTIILGGTLGGGTGTATKNGTGLLIINGTNSYTGTTTINTGTMQFGATGSLPPASALTINAAGTLDLNGFNESILSLAGAGSVTLGSGTLTLNNTLATTYSGIMSGSGGLVQAGTSVLTLSGANTFSGGVTINRGSISVKSDSYLGNTNAGIILNGGTLTIALAFNSARAITLGTNGGVLNVSGNITASGVVSGPGTLTKLGTSTLTLAASNTYLGGTIMSAGGITVSSDAQLGNSNSSFTFSTNSTLTTTASFASLRNFILGSGTATISAGTGFTNTLNGVISGSGALTQSGAGVLVLGGSNTFTNLLTISKGTVRLGASERLSDAMLINISSTSGIFDLNGFNETIGSLAAAAAGKVTLGNGFLTAGGNNLTTTNAAVISGNGGFTKAGSGTLVFSSANTYTNTTTISSGTLQISASERIANTSPLVVSNGATFNLNNFNETVASLAGAGAVTLGSGTFTLGNATTTTFAGTVSGTGAFTKIGAGTQILTGSNSFTGATTISLGNLQVNGTNTSSAVTVASTATLSGNGSVGTVVINSSGTNSPGASATDTLTSGGETWAGGGNYIWNINNAIGVKGTGSGWDWLNISGSLTITASSSSPFRIRLTSLTPANAAGPMTNFDNTVTYIWTIASASGGITGFNAASFSLDASGFQNPLGSGAFAVSQSGNNLNLIFTTALQPVVKNVQSGTLTSTGNGTNTVTLASSINPSNAFLVFNTRHNSSSPGGSMVRGRITSTNTVEFARTTLETSTINIQWYVAEYSAGVRVQRGEISQTNTTINVPLTALSATNQAFVTWSKTPEITASGFDDSDPLVGEITSTTNLQFRVGALPTLPLSYPVISWQVVEFTHPAAINVQKGSITNLTGTNLQATATLGTAVDTNGAFLLTGYRTSGTGTSIGPRLLRARFTDASTITFDRSTSGAPDDITEIAWQAVQLKDGSLVQSGSANFPSGVAETNINLATSLNTNRAVAFSSVQPVGGQNTGRSPSTGNVLGVGSATLLFSTISQITLDRNNTSDQSDLAWNVVGLGPSSILAPATGGAAISADTKGGAYTSLTGPVYTEILNGNAGAGTVILNAPAGFVYDTSVVQPTVLITRVGGSGANSLNINGVASGTSVAMTTVATNALTFTITTASSGGVTCSLTWQNLRVRPLAGTPLANGNITSSGTAVIQGVTTNSTSWGFLNEVVGAATKLAIATAPSSTAVADVDFVQQPVIQIQDQFGNLRTADNASVVTVTNSGTTVLEGVTNTTVIGGIAAFNGLDYTLAQTIKLGFSAPGLAGATSGNIVVSPAPASQLTVLTQPSASVTAGVNFPQQPVVRVEDPYGNLRSTDNSTVVTALLDQGSDVLFGTQTATAVSGVATFTNLSYENAEVITIDFTSGTLDPETSAAITVNPAAANQLVIQTQPSAVATAGVAFAQQPAIQLQDAFGNLCVSNNSTVVTASRNTGSGSGTLQGTLTATASGGIATFANLSHKVVGVISIDFNSGVLTNTTSGSIAINAAAAAQLAFSTQPGSATVGSAFGVQPTLVTQDAYGNASVFGIASSLPVGIAITSGTGTLQGTTNFDIGTAAGNGAVAFSNLRIDSSGSKQLTASASGLASGVSAAFNVAVGPQTISFNALSNKNYGDAPFSLSASASSGLPVSFAIVSGPASVSSSNVTILGAGTVTVSASQAGNANYTNATPVNQSFTVAPAVLMVTASNATRVFGAANPAFTAGYSGFVYSDNVGVLSGTPAFNTTANAASTVAGSPYPITVTNGTLSASNYSFSFQSGQLTVTPATSSLAVSTSTNPSPTGSNVTLTATVTAVSPGSGTPTGTIQFLADGVALGSSVSLSSGVASRTTNSLSHGTHTIAARYAGDGNFLGITNTLSPNLIINTAPIANTVQLQRYPSSGVKVRITSVLTNDSDPDGDAISFISINPTSTNGGTVTLQGGGNWIDYAPPAGVTNADSFNYVIADSGGLQTTGRVSVAILTDVAPAQNAVATNNLGNGNFVVSFSGIPSRTYTVQYATNLSLPNWQSLGTATTDSIGRFNYTDAPPTNSPPRFYRSTYP